MRSRILGVLCSVVLLACAYLGAHGQNEPAKVRLRLIDAGSGKGVAGIVRVLSSEDKKPIPLPGLLPRMQGLSKNELALGWHVVPVTGADTILPPSSYRVEAFSGVESAVLSHSVDVKGGLEIVLPLTYLFRPESKKLYAGNTHLHLRDLTLDKAEDYLLKIPPADRLQLLFISYLKRVKDDAAYITNDFPIGDLPKLSFTGVLVNNGEEHRHNFQGYGQGYGHVMFLNIKKLVEPVSIGPGIMGKGFDDPALRPGIDNALSQGGTVIWCHNNNGHEDIPSVLAGKLHALNFFDGSRAGSYEENYYHYLNIGVPLAASTGTDWFQYDFSRVYARVPGKLSVQTWLEAVRAGRCQATNGPLLSLKIDGKDIGERLELSGPEQVTIEASVVARNDFQKLQLVHNGVVIKTVPSASKGPFTAELVHKVRVDEPGWFAVRIDSKEKNELDRQLYAHTSPIYVDVAGKRRFDVEAARALLKQVEEGQATIEAKSTFSNPAAKRQVAALYEQAAKDLRERIEKRGK